LVSELQSYILSTTTETVLHHGFLPRGLRFNRTSFQQQLKRWVASDPAPSNGLQSYILSTTTETNTKTCFTSPWPASIVHPFNNN